MCDPELVKDVSDSSTSASVPDCVEYFALIAKIRPVGPVIGCTPHTSYAIRLGIERRIIEMRMGS